MNLGQTEKVRPPFLSWLQKKKLDFMCLIFHVLWKGTVKGTPWYSGKEIDSTVL